MKLQSLGKKKKFWERTDGEEAAKEEHRGKRGFC